MWPFTKAKEEPTPPLYRVVPVIHPRLGTMCYQLERRELAFDDCGSYYVYLLVDNTFGSVQQCTDMAKHLEQEPIGV